MLRGDGLLPEGISLYDTEPGLGAAPRRPGAARPQAVRARRRLHRQGRQGRHHRRVHRPHDGGRRYSEGLHQALEAKEDVEIQRENQTLASITFQNYFRMYPKLAGMTGTAMTEAAEFGEIYKLEVVEIPTNVPGRAQGRRRRGLPHARARRRRAIVDADRGVPRRAASRCWSAPCRSRSPRRCRSVLKKAKHPAQRAERPLPRAGSRRSSPRPAGPAP